MSLRDQLLQAGLLSEKQAKQAAREQSQQRRGPARKATPTVDESRRAAQAKADRDRELNRQREEQAERKARRAQLRQLVEQHRLPKPDSDEWYNFVDGRKIRRLPADAALRARLASGEVAIVRNDGRYEFVPAAIAERIREREPHAVVAQGPAPSAMPADENDPYKHYVVPDDLMW